MKNMLNTFLRTLLLVTLFSCKGFATKPSAPIFEKDDTIVFIGDSITHSGAYHSNIFLFYATRFPEKAFKYYNCGISGDTAAGTVARFDKDIAVYNPNIATIMLGMNDVGRSNFDKDKTSPEDLAIQERSFLNYAKSMDLLASKLIAIGCRIIFITPSIYDQTARIETENHFGVNDGLERFSRQVEELAEKYDGSVVDFHTIMTRINGELQKSDPAFTIVGSDRVHPGSPGHLLMAYAFLRAQQMPEYVSTIEIDAASGAFTKTKNCKIGVPGSPGKFDPAMISFSCREFALPFPVSESQKPALEWVPFQQQLNQQLITVANLESGSYTLKIDGIYIDTYSAVDLSRGVNLAGNPSTPQYQQALKVKALNDKRHKIERQIRTIAHVRHKTLADCKTIPEDDEVLRKLLLDMIEKHKGKSWYGHLKKQGEKYIEIRRSESDFRQQVELLFLQIEQAGKPVIHQWTIMPRKAS